MKKLLLAASITILIAACTKTVVQRVPVESKAELDPACSCTCPTPDTNPYKAYLDACIKNMMEGRMNVTNTNLLFYNECKSDKLIDNGAGANDRFADTMQRYQTGKVWVYVGNSIINNINPEWSFRPGPFGNRGLGGSVLPQIRPFFPDILYCYPGLETNGKIWINSAENELAQNYTIERMKAEQKITEDSIRKYMPNVEITWTMSAYCPRYWPLKSKMDDYADYLKNEVTARNPKNRYMEMRDLSLNSDGTLNAAMFTSDNVHRTTAYYEKLMTRTKQHFVY